MHSKFENTNFTSSLDAGRNKKNNQRSIVNLKRIKILFLNFLNII